MNWRRGLFRLWIVGTALFVIAVASISYSHIKAQFDAAALKQTAAAVLPEGFILDQQESTRIPGPPCKGYFDDLIPGNHCTPLRTVDDPIPEPKPWVSVGWTAGIAFGIPLVVLILGASLVWAFSGFAVTNAQS